MRIVLELRSETRSASSPDLETMIVIVSTEGLGSLLERKQESYFERGAAAVDLRTTS